MSRKRTDHACKRYLRLARERRIGSALLGWGVFQLGTGLLTPYVDNWAHLGGLAAGIIFGLTLPAGLF